MRSKTAQRMLDKMPEEIKNRVRNYANLLVSEGQLKQEAINFADWLWNNISENEMSTKSWNEFYNRFKSSK